MNENQTPEEENQIEQLALRLLVTSADPRVNRPRLFLGKIPADLPVEIPLLEQSRILGTLLRSDAHIEIVLTSDLKADEIMNFYREHLKPLGWTELENLNQHHIGGFLYSNPSNYVTFCQGPEGASLMLMTMQIEDTTTDVRLNLNLDAEGNPCSRQQIRMRRGMGQHGINRVIPPLSSPADTQQHTQNSSSGTNEANTSATLKTDLSLDVVHAHYATQLNQAGWVQTTAGTNGPVAWSNWQFTDEDQEPWHGQFFVLTTPDQSEDYFLFARANWNNPAKR